VARYFPEFPDLYARAGWTMFQSIDRVYDSAKALRRLAFQCRVGFKEKLQELQRLLDRTAM
jgi:UDP-glucose 4-epimerase